MTAFTDASWRPFARELVGNLILESLYLCLVPFSVTWDGAYLLLRRRTRRPEPWISIVAFLVALWLWTTVVWLRIWMRWAQTSRDHLDVLNFGNESEGNNNSFNPYAAACAAVSNPVQSICIALCMFVVAAVAASTPAPCLDSWRFPCWNIAVWLTA